MRPKNSTKKREPIFSYEFDRLIFYTKKLKLTKTTKNKLIIAFTLLYLTGCRVSEILNIKFIDIQNLKKFGKISLSNKTKTKQTRTLNFTDKQLEFINKLPLEHCNSDSYLFYKNGTNRPMSTSFFTRLLNNCLKEILGECYTTHSFRAGYINKICEVSNLEVAKELVGHRGIKTTMRYLTATKEQKTEALKKAFL